MRSVFLDYYIGSLLLWKGKKENFLALSCEPVYGYDGKGSPEYIVLDGQQRLRAMYYASVVIGKIAFEFPIHFPILLGGNVLGVMEFFSFTI